MPLYTLILIAGLKVLLMVLNGLFTKITLEAFDKKISIKESSYISLITALGNYFGPLLGGMGIRAAYLKKKHDFALTHFVGTTYGYYLITFFSTSILGLLSLLAININYGEFSVVITAIFASIATVTGLLLLIKFPEGKSSNHKLLNSLYKRLGQVSQGWNQLYSNKKLLKRLLSLSVLVFSVGVLVSFIEFFALGINISFSSLILYTTLGSISVLVSLTPGAIGIREAIYIFSSSTMMITNSEIIQLAAIDRGVTILVLVGSYIIVYFYGLNKKRSQTNSSNNSIDTSSDTGV